MDSKTIKRAVHIAAAIAMVGGFLYFGNRIVRAAERAAEGHRKIGDAFSYGYLRVL